MENDFCENYEGTLFEANGDDLVFVSPADAVALNTVTYVKGVGMNVRIINIPGSYSQAFLQETAPFGICDCLPPAVWYFVGIDGPNVSVFSTLDGHEAVHYLQHPDHIFDSEASDAGISEVSLPMVPAEDGLDLVMIELQDRMAALGVPGMKSEGDITFNEVSSIDVDDLIGKFQAAMEENENDDSE